STKELFQEFFEIHVAVEGLGSGFELDEEIEVAFGRGLTSGLRTEQAETPGSEASDGVFVPGKGLEDLVSFLAHCALSGSSLQPPPSKKRPDRQTRHRTYWS